MKIQINNSLLFYVKSVHTNFFLYFNKYYSKLVDN